MARNQRNSNNDKAERMIHIRLKADTHRRLRVQAAEEDVTIQDWVTGLIEQELSNPSYVSRKNKKVAKNG